MTNADEISSIDGISPRVGRFVTISRRQFHLVSEGVRLVVLLRHSNGSTGEEIRIAFQHCAVMRFIGPDRPCYGFSNLMPEGSDDPGSLGYWIDKLVDVQGVRAIRVAAHSLAAGGALCFAHRHTTRVLSLTLISPICRSTLHRYMPVLRIAVCLLVGKVVRAVLACMRGHVLGKLAAPDGISASLSRLPIAHLAKPRAVLTVAAELRQCNEGIKRANPQIGDKVPVVVIFGTEDETAVVEQNAPKLHECVKRIGVRELRGHGRMIHHE